jgi:ABC-type dipeptide/oligopeptide/nickel transport system permease component
VGRLSGTPVAPAAAGLAAGLFSLAYISRMTRSFMLNELARNTSMAARAKGLSETRIIWRHALRNAMVPLVTVIALSYAGLLEGSVLTETVFAWPGLGPVHHQLAAKRRHERGARRHASSWARSSSA